jgi:phycoerythrobilin:ferredoxin oxidoreductase
VINFVIFPEPHLSLPIFGADLVTLPGGDLVALDFQPMGDMDDAYMSTYYTTLRGVYDAARASLPPGGGEIPEAAAAFFSPMHLFGRVAHDAPDLAGTQKACDDAFMGYLHAYLDLIVAGAGGEKVDAKEVAARQGAYSRYRYEKDPARGMLKRLFGEEYTEHVLKDFLFDLVKLDE